MSSTIFKEIKDDLVSIEQNFSSIEMMKDKVRADFEIDRLKTTIEALPEEIANANTKLQEAKNDLPNFEEQLKVIEAEQMFLINNETNGDKKSKFTNEGSRKAELIKRLSIHEEYGVIKVQKIGLEGQIFTLENEVEKLKNQFRAVMAIKDLVCSELSIYKL